MRREDLPDLMAFAIIAEERSFTRASVRLGLTTSALSHAVRLLEERLGTKLLNRTTRSVSPTVAGNRLLERLAPALAEIDHGLDALGDDRDHPRGLVRINAHRSAATLHVMPKLELLAERYPDIVLELSIDDRIMDIVGAGFDAGIRDGERVAKDMVIVRIGPSYSTAIVAAPRYLSKAPKIAAPRDLIAHRALAYRLPTARTLWPWTFREGSSEFVVDVRPSFISDDMHLVIGAAVAGTGIAYVLRQQVEIHLLGGTLVELLPGSAMTFTAPHLYYPSRKHIRPALRAVIDLLRH